MTQRFRPARIVGGVALIVIGLAMHATRRGIEDQLGLTIDFPVVAAVAWVFLGLGVSVLASLRGRATPDEPDAD